MKHLGLFEGIGGFSLAARCAGWETPVMVEWNPYCQAVLKKNFPNAAIFGDIRQFDGTAYAGQIDIITGGFPCQPFSHAGKRAGSDDDRYLWPEMLRVIREVAPAWVVGENVAGLLSMDGGRVFAGILADLENAGYSPEIYIIPAVGVGAPHRRDSVWIVARRDNIERDRSRGACNGRAEFADENSGATTDADKQGCKRWHEQYTSPGIRKPYWPTSEQGQNDRAWNTPHAKGIDGGKQHETARSIGESGNAWENTWRGDWGMHWYEVATRICGVDDGIPGGLDGTTEIPAAKGRSHRLEALGNAIVPQIAFQIFNAINMAEEIVI